MQIRKAKPKFVPCNFVKIEGEPPPQKKGVDVWEK